MIIGVAGLGLIGGSLAKAYKEQPGNTVYGYDIDPSIAAFARLSGAIDGVLDQESARNCDCVFIAIFPEDARNYLREMAPYFNPQGLVIDCCGTKRLICEEGFSLARQYGFTFAGGHPMAGSHHAGFRNSRANLFKGACMVIVPPVFDDMALLERIRIILEPLNLAKITVSQAEKHDQLIAYTSQLAHLASNAFVKSPASREHRGYSAGSYLDLTRVAWLDPQMWAELFLENEDFLLSELDIYIAALCHYRDALSRGDREMLIALLEAGRQIKQEVDGR
jgi:prephenate dehydrogenase